MAAMQARPRHCSPPWSTVRSTWAGLALWLATLLFVLQGGLHAAMPPDMNMAEMVGGLFTAPVHGGPGAPATHTESHAPDAMPGMSTRDLPTHDVSTHDPPRPPAHPAKHAAEGLCCMTPAAVLPVLWAPPAPLLIQTTQTPPEALHEALLRLRATARGPPTVA